METTPLPMVVYGYLTQTMEGIALTTNNGNHGNADITHIGVIKRPGDLQPPISETLKSLDAIAEDVENVVEQFGKPGATAPRPEVISPVEAIRKDGAAMVALLENSGKYHRDMVDYYDRLAAQARANTEERAASFADELARCKRIEEILDPLFKA